MLTTTFLDMHRDRTWQPGTVDCLLALADWLVARSFEDPAAGFRGRYDSEAGFRGILSAQGGMVALIGRQLEPLGIATTETPIAGDIGVIGSRLDPHRQWGALFDGRDWQVRNCQGWIAVKARAIAIWRTGAVSCRP